MNKLLLTGLGLILAAQSSISSHAAIDADAGVVQILRAQVAQLRQQVASLRAQSLNAAANQTASGAQINAIQAEVQNMNAEIAQIARGAAQPIDYRPKIWACTLTSYYNHSYIGRSASKLEAQGIILNACNAAESNGPSCSNGATMNCEQIIVGN